MPLEELHRSLVLLRSLPGLERAQIAAPAGFRVFLARIEAKFSGWKFANHTFSINLHASESLWPGSTASR